MLKFNRREVFHNPLLTYNSQSWSVQFFPLSRKKSKCQVRKKSVSYVLKANGSKKNHLLHMWIPYTLPLTTTCYSKLGCALRFLILFRPHLIIMDSGQVPVGHIGVQPFEERLIWSRICRNLESARTSGGMVPRINIFPFSKWTKNASIKMVSLAMLLMPLLHDYRCCAGAATAGAAAAAAAAASAAAAAAAVAAAAAAASGSTSLAPTATE